LKTQGYKIIESGTRRSLKRIAFFPFYLLHSIIFRGNIDGGVFWDIFGFAEYILTQRIENNEI